MLTAVNRMTIFPVEEERVKRSRKPKQGTTLVRIKSEQLRRLRERKAETGVPMREQVERALAKYLEPGS